MLSVLPSIVILGLAALAAFSMSRLSPPENLVERHAAVRMLALATGIQGIHFAEEAVTGFNEQFPALFGQPPIPIAVFVGFNLIWLGIWAASVAGLRSARPTAFFAAWFLAIAGILNGIAHPLLAVTVGGYFPGLLSSPVIGVAGIYLWRRLGRATRVSGSVLTQNQSR